jgi:hypothetical protein
MLLFSHGQLTVRKSIVGCASNGWEVFRIGLEIVVPEWQGVALDSTQVSILSMSTE